MRKRAGTVLHQSSVSHTSEVFLSLGKGGVPMVLALDLTKENGGQSILLLRRQLGCFVKRFLKKFSHDRSSPEDSEYDLTIPRGLAFGCTMGHWLLARPLRGHCVRSASGVVWAVNCN